MEHDGYGVCRAPEATARRLFGVLVTFRRPKELVEMLARLSAQDRLLDALVVVDNAPTEAGAAAVAANAELGHTVEYVAAAENLGPAGGIALGMERVLQLADDRDWIVLFDDDDPPDAPTNIQDLSDFITSTLAGDPSTAGVGICGSRFDWRRGRQVRPGDDELDGPVPVDSLGGNHLPMYQVQAVRRVGTYDPKLFFGFEELAFGLQLRGAGYSLYACGPLWHRGRAARGRMGLTLRPAVGLDEATWRRYYGLRNLVRILLDHGHPLVAARVSAERGLLKPLVNLPRHPGLAWRHLRLNAAACRDAWTGRMGRTVEPDAEKAHTRRNHRRA